MVLKLYTSFVVTVLLSLAQLTIKPFWRVPSKPFWKWRFFSPDWNHVLDSPSATATPWKSCCTIVTTDLLCKANSSSSLNIWLQWMVQQCTWEQNLTYFHCLCTSSTHKSRSKISSKRVCCLKPCTNKSRWISIQTEKSLHQMTS